MKINTRFRPTKRSLQREIDDLRTLVYKQEEKIRVLADHCKVWINESPSVVKYENEVTPLT